MATEHESDLRLILETSPIAVTVVGPDGRFTYANQHALELLQCDEAAFLSLRARDLYADPEARRQVAKTLAERGSLRNFEAELKRADGAATVWALLSVSSLQTEGGTSYVNWIVDISARKAEESALRRSEQTFVSMLETSPVGARVTRASDGRIVFVNARYAEQFGQDKKSLIGSSVVEAYVDPEARKALIDRFYAVGELHDEEVRFKRADGQEFQALMSMRPCSYEGEDARLTWFYDITARKREEEELRQAKLAAEMALGELQQAQQRLVHSEKLASLGQLTAGIAHEIKNPLNFVNNFSETSVELLAELKEAVEPLLGTLDGETRENIDELFGLLNEDLGKIASHGKRADGIVKSMLLHARGGGEDWAKVDINELVAEALKLAYHGERAHDKSFQVTMEEELDPGAGTAEVTPQNITRVLVNICSNAFHAVKTRTRESGGNGYEPTVSVVTRRDGGWVEVRVRDNGTGMPDDVRERLFDPFFTTKPTGEGTGLGLSISYDIVAHQHGGEIRADSTPGEFTEFVIRLPSDRARNAGNEKEART